MNTSTDEFPGSQMPAGKGRPLGKGKACLQYSWKHRNIEVKGWKRNLVEVENRNACPEATLCMPDVSISRCVHGALGYEL